MTVETNKSVKPASVNFFGHNKVFVKQNIALRFLRIGTQTEFFNFFHQQTGNADDVDIEDGMLGHRAVAHFKNNVAVGLAGFFHFGAGVLPAVHQPVWDCG